MILLVNIYRQTFLKMTIQWFCTYFNELNCQVTKYKGKKGVYITRASSLAMCELRLTVDIILIFFLFWQIRCGRCYDTGPGHPNGRSIFQEEKGVGGNISRLGIRTWHRNHVSLH